MSNTLLRAILYGGKVYKFNFKGVYVGEDKNIFGVLHPQEVDVISVLYQDGAVEIAVNINGVFTKKGIAQDLTDVVKRITSLKPVDNIFSGIRNLDHPAKAVQYLYVFKAGSLKLTDILS